MKQPVHPKAKNRVKQLKRTALLSLALCVFFSATMAVTAHAADFTINVGNGGEAGGLGALEVIFIFAFLALLPSVFLMMTSFTRIIIVLSFTRNAIGTGQSPPNMVLIGLSIFLSLFIMMPVIQEMNTTAFIPFQEEEITAQEALTAATVPVKKFMIQNVEPDSLRLFLGIADMEVPLVADAQDPVELYDLPLTVITPAFITSEISRAFMMGFLVFLPFLIIDMVVSSILMSMGMVMLPPAMISLPFKILLFVMVDGWNLLMGTLVRSFTMYQA
ncbi:flagellar type III secretion system pore protein FliP [Ruminococcaceae bacterium OttesenSCG-928-O06]|nr:flagellar type III secretion system pore protein FliP [Ruminococcaceae bacterium OttesenSCG-928-O06]